MKYKLARYSSVFFLIVVIIAFTINRDEKFTVSQEIVFNEIISGASIANEETLLKVSGDENSEYLIIDVRTPGKFIKGHVTNSINVPVKDMLDPIYTSIYKNTNKPIIIYGDYTCDAHRAYNMFRQMGVENINVIAGGYEYFIEFGDWVFPVESAKYDFAEIMKEKNGGTAVELVEPVKAVKKLPVKKKERAEGGC